MNLGDSLGTIGLFLCVGAIILVAVVAFAFRALTKRANSTANRDNVFNDRGDATPRYDDREVRTGGGFGGIPTTGPDLDLDMNRDTGANRPGRFERDNDPDTRGTSGFGSSAFGDADRGELPRRGDSPRSAPRRADDDDDEVRSKGGFGGS